MIPVFLFPKRIKIIAAVIGVVLWAASLAALEEAVPKNTARAVYDHFHPRTGEGETQS